jgi:hypothetical protein
MSIGSLPLVGEYSTYPEFRCKSCGADLWTERSGRTGWRTWLVTKTGLRHFKTRCNLYTLRDSEAK